MYMAFVSCPLPLRSIEHTTIAMACSRLDGLSCNFLVEEWTSPFFLVHRRRSKAAAGFDLSEDHGSCIIT